MFSMISNSNHVYKLPRNELTEESSTSNREYKYFLLTHFMKDTILVSNIFGTNFINTGNLEKYFIESCSDGLIFNFSWICPSNHGLVSIKAAHHYWMNKFKKSWLCMKFVKWTTTIYVHNFNGVLSDIFSDNIINNSRIFH